MRIILDAGHGINTPGKRSPDDSIREFQFNSMVADLVKDVLDKYANVDVRFTHAKLRDVPLRERVNAAINFRADAYVSIHANAYGNDWNSAQGIETYVAPSRPKEATALAYKVQQKLVQYTGRKDRGVKTADFYVLTETPMTAILAECGFMTNRAEADLLKSIEYRRHCARAIAEALVEIYGLKKKVTSPEQTGGYFKVQVGAFKNKSEAIKLSSELKKKGYDNFIKYE